MQAPLTKPLPVEGAPPEAAGAAAETEVVAAGAGEPEPGMTFKAASRRAELR